MNALGIFGTSSDSFSQMLNDLNINKNLKHHICMKAPNIAIRGTYYIYFKLNKQCTYTELLQY